MCFFIFRTYHRMTARRLPPTFARRHLQSYFYALKDRILLHLLTSSIQIAQPVGNPSPGTRCGTIASPPPWCTVGFFSSFPLWNFSQRNFSSLNHPRWCKFPQRIMHAITTRLALIMCFSFQGKIVGIGRRVSRWHWSQLLEFYSHGIQ